MASYIRTDDHLTIVFDDGVSAHVYANTPRFKDVRDALNAKNYELARKLALPAEQVKSQLRETFGYEEDQVTIEHGIVKYEGKEMENTLTRRMLQMLDEGFDIAPLKLFLINLQGNPSFRAVNELYGFLEKGNLPITEDGYFLAYKKVGADYKDCHTHTVLNKLAAEFTHDELISLPIVSGNVTVDIVNGVTVVSMPRNYVDEDSRNECSNGLHFCSKDYLSAFRGEHTMIVKINPADVVAIPADYNSSKGRTCRYEVFGELEAEGKLEGSFRDTGTRPSILEDIYHIEDEEEVDDEENDCQDPNCIVCNEEYDHVDDELEEELESLMNSFEDELESAMNKIFSSEVRIEATDTIEGVNEVLFVFDSIEKASEFSGASVSAIRRVLSGERKTTAGYGWRYETSEDVTDSAFVGLPTNDTVIIPRDVALEIAASLEEDEITVKPDVQARYDNAYPIVATNPTTDVELRAASIKNASQITGVNESSIRKAINGQRKTAGGFVWKDIRNR